MFVVVLYSGPYVLVGHVHTRTHSTMVGPRMPMCSEVILVCLYVAVNGRTSVSFNLTQFLHSNVAIF